MKTKKEKNKGGRPRKSTTLMSEALKDKNITELYWAFLEHSVAEIRNEGELKTFSGNHIVSMLAELGKLLENVADNDPEAEQEMENFLKLLPKDK